MDSTGHDNPKKELMLKALEKALGVVTIACKETDTPRSTHYMWMNSDENYFNAVNDLQEVVLDFAEAKLHKMIEKEDTAATIFLLKTKGKKRGYIERTELSGPNGEPITLAFEKVPSFLSNMETKKVENGVKGLQTKGGFIPG